MPSKNKFIEEGPGKAQKPIICQKERSAVLTAAATRRPDNVPAVSVADPEKWKGGFKLYPRTSAENF